MFSTAITLRPNGSMTLPKKIRDEFQTAHFIVMKVEGGVFLRPIREEIEYYKKDDGMVGLHFPYGMEAGRLADMFEETIEKIDKASPRRRKHG